MRVEAHLHIRKYRNGEEACISVRPLPADPVHYSGTVTLSNVTFAVQQAGQKRYRDSGQKNVHAYVRGDVVDEHGNQIPKPRNNGTAWVWREAYYNPAVTDTFVDRQTGQVLDSAMAAYLVGNKVYYIP